ncbi:hypothetical protein [Mesorhizobium sp.]|uniref:hypothetical protein n=1 Tax=Mesorhizobium sp. TaxID=1871066 RepID=UPI00121ABCF5|nr:hypothetical protein [Mesorhizobium sp.]TIL30005.1 MAG: hypothetical protein E5Y85_25585 [Mesorhizobium sp.]
MFEPAERKQFAIQVSPKVFDAVTKRAREQGLTPTGYAKLLFEAGFAARIGQERAAPVDDAELDRQVTLVFACAGHGDVAAIKKATGVAEATIERILKAWRKTGVKA